MKKKIVNKLSKREKVINYVIVVVLMFIAYLFYDYVSTMNKESKSLLTKEPVSAEFTVIGSWRTKLSGNIFEYSVSGKSLKFHNRNEVTYFRGECFHGIYAKSKPEYVKIDLTSPILNGKDNFEEMSGKVKKVNKNSNPNSVRYTYRFLGKGFERTVYVKDAKIYEVDKYYRILVYRKKPSVSYLKDQVVM
ncbi:hypothetical protein EYV94_18720 [Puteibacter caeruleilacunae]|nr:hypothetical protein EYV94_18720 [Puteibacter caeruleilacunae]